MANGYSVRKHGDIFAAFQKGVLIAKFLTKREADDFIAEQDNKKNQKNFEIAQVEKTNRIGLKELLDDEWEPYAVDDKFHYLKKK